MEYTVHMAARISILSDLQIILNISKHILQNAVGAKPIQFYHKPRETDGKHLYLNIQVTYEVTQSAMMTKNTLLIHFFFTFPPSFTQFTSSWPHPQFFLVFLWSLCAVLSLSDPSSDGDLCVLGSSLVAPDPHGVCCPVCWT